MKVTTPESAVGVSLSAAVLGNSRNLSAEATAGLSVPLNVFCNFIPLSVLIDNDDTKLVKGETYVIRAGTGGSPSPGNYQILAVAGPGGVDVELASALANAARRSGENVTLIPARLTSVRSSRNQFSFDYYQASN